MPTTCGPFAEDNQFLPPGQQHSGRVHSATCHMVPTAAVWSRESRSESGRHCGLTLLRTANPLTGRGRMPSGRNSVFSNIFAEDTIAASAYNSFQASLEKRFSRGLQFQAAYTFSKSLDWASSFEETVNPFNYKASRALSLFNSKQRFVINYVWDIPAAQVQRFEGQGSGRLATLRDHSVPERFPDPPADAGRHRVDQQLVLPGRGGAAAERSPADRESQADPDV